MGLEGVAFSTKEADAKIAEANGVNDEDRSPRGRRSLVITNDGLRLSNGSEARVGSAGASGVATPMILEGSVVLG